MKQIPRRKVLQWGLGAGADGRAGRVRRRPRRSPTPTTTTPPAAVVADHHVDHHHEHDDDHHTTTTMPPAPVASRSLVVIDMAGGHDGNSLGIPFADGAYYSRRPTVSIPPARCCG